ncbi:hypothetical protein HY633_03000 [Candidatus Uhrbacteria bacterium]|nr:hypothetical protein [Candidatus Uhrbacteria bacterium]
MTRLKSTVSIVVSSLLFATACDAGGSAEGIPEKFDVVYRLERADGSLIVDGRITCELQKQTKCNVFLPYRDGAFVITRVPDNVRGRNPKWPKGMIAMYTTDTDGYGGWHGLRKDPDIVPGDEAVPGVWDPLGNYYMPYTRFEQGFTFNVNFRSLSKKQNAITGGGPGRVLLRATR